MRPKTGTAVKSGMIGDYSPPVGYRTAYLEQKSINRSQWTLKESLSQLPSPSPARLGWALAAG